MTTEYVNIHAGLTAVGVSLVVSAASSLTRGICVGVDQQLITVLSAAAAFYYQAAWIYPALILGGELTRDASLRMRGAVRTAAVAGLRGLQVQKIIRAM